jgi:YesN/AraC family two-component response regulator
VGTGGKIAVGCAVAVVAVGLVLTIAFGGLVFWAKGKVEKVAGEQQRIADLEKRADQIPYERPADGVIPEPRLVKFIDVRKRVFETYKKYEKDLETRGKKEKAELGDITTAFTAINDIRSAQAQALIDLGMSKSEYSFMVEQVYKSFFAAEVAKSTGGKSVSEAAREAYDQAADAMAKAEQDAQRAKQQARASGDQAAEEASERSRQAVAEGAEELKKQAGEMTERARDLDVPPANVALFRKYEAELKKYAMGGLEWIGL